MRSFRGLGFILAIVLGLYLLNNGFGWVTIPASLQKAEKFLDIISGIVLILFGLTTLLRPPRYGAY